MIRKLISAACLLLCSTTLAQAATLCATNGAELAAALATAAGNGEADEIRLAIGTYAVPASGTFGFSPSGAQDHDIEISGGWSEFFGNPCGQRFDDVDPFMTALQGDGSERVMNIVPPLNSTMDVAISRVAFIGGDAGSGEGGGLRVYGFAGSSGDIRLDQCAFVGNSANDHAALVLIGEGRLEVRNSLFVANVAQENHALSVFGLGEDGVYLIGNTILNNTVTSPAGTVIGGASISTAASSRMLLVNNLAWGNDGFDIQMSGAGDRWYRNNNVEDLSDVNDQAMEADNLSVAPVFESGFFNYTPAEGSPMRDAGRKPPTFTPIPIPFESNWSTGTRDVFGRVRVQGDDIDIGAYESRPIELFVDGFE